MGLSSDLDLVSVLRWRDEVGLRRGVLYDEGKVEFEQWPVPPYEYLIDIFENIFRRQLVFPWMNGNLNSLTLHGTHSKGTCNNPPFFSFFSFIVHD